MKKTFLKQRGQKKLRSRHKLKTLRTRPGNAHYGVSVLTGVTKGYMTRLEPGQIIKSIIRAKPKVGYSTQELDRIEELAKQRKGKVLNNSSNAKEFVKGL